MATQSPYTTHFADAKFRTDVLVTLLNKDYLIKCEGEGDIVVLIADLYRICYRNAAEIKQKAENGMINT